MFGFLKNLFLTKEAQEALKTMPKGTMGKAARQALGSVEPTSERERAIAAMQSQAKDLVTDERAELIRKAMQVRRAKQTVLADLSDEQRQKLVALALRKLLNEDPNKKPEEE